MFAMIGDSLNKLWHILENQVSFIRVARLCVGWKHFPKYIEKFKARHRTLRLIVYPSSSRVLDILACMSNILNYSKYAFKKDSHCKVGL